MSNINTTLTIKTSKKLRNDAKKVAESLGVPLTTAVNAMLRQFVRDRRLLLEEECPFPNHTPNAETRRAIKEVQEGKNLISMSFDEFSKYVQSIA